MTQGTRDSDRVTLSLMSLVSLVSLTTIMTGQHLILYDGVCGLCNRLVQFVLKRDFGAVFQFASIQSDFGQSLLKAHGKDPDSLETVCVIAGFRTESPVLLSRSRAALFVSEKLGGPWPFLAAIVGILPGRLLDWAYDLVARCRYRIWGRYESCPLPNPLHKSRFIDRGPTNPSEQTSPAQPSKTGQTGDRGKSPRKRSR